MWELKIFYDARENKQPQTQTFEGLTEATEYMLVEHESWAVERFTLLYHDLPED